MNVLIIENVNSIVKFCEKAVIHGVVAALQRTSFVFVWRLAQLSQGCVSFVRRRICNFPNQSMSLTAFGEIRRRPGAGLGFISFC